MLMNLLRSALRFTLRRVTEPSTTAATGGGTGPEPTGIPWDNGVTWDNGVYWS